MFDKKTMRGVPTSLQDLEVNEDGYYVYGQNIKRQYDFKVLWDKGYLHEVDSRKPLIAYTSSVGEVGVINESFYRTGDNGAFQGLIQKDKTNHTEYGTIYLLTVLKKLFIQFSYNTSMRLILDLELELPVLTTDSTEPYWDYMAYYIHNIQHQYADQLEAKSEYEIALMCQILGVTRDDITKRVELTQPQYTNTFKVDELFVVTGTKSTNAGTLEFKDCGVEFIGRTSVNNGVQGYIDELEYAPNEEGTITISQVGTIVAQYRGDPYYTSQNIAKLEYNRKLSKEEGMYFVTCINKHLQLYGGYQTPKLDDIKNIILELPVIAPNSKQIDWGAIRHAAVGGGGINYLATRMEICNRDLAIIRQLIQ